MEAGGVGLALQTRAAAFGSGQRRGGLQSPIGRLRVAEPAGAAVAVRVRGSKPVVPLRAKKSSGGVFLHYTYCGHIGLIRLFFCLFVEFVAISIRSNRIKAIFGFAIIVEFHGIDV